ncbi:helix-turn-helix domain-containing protein [Clostridium peptidivorans]|uniref:helix-turn-helix domain-containing protein n=1 Tax=Clostridium peptidivorans TaxID=100174 RepID=UPI000BE378C3|nr:helix-turn-helix transcriptional regulator [Clostridium peptidivorans]
MGLKKILKIYNISVADLAQRLGIARGNIYNWFNGKRKIPKSMLEKLSQLFNLPEEFFCKELSEIDILNIKKTMVENLIDDSFKNAETDEAEQCISNSLLEWKNSLCDDIDNLEMKNSILSRISETLNGKNIDGISKNYNNVADVIDSNKVPHSVLNDVLQAVLFSYDVKEYKSNNKFIDDLMKIIKDYENERQREKKELDELIKSSKVWDLFS